MAVTPIQLNPDGEYIELIPISCLHIGAAQFEENRALRFRSHALESPDRYVWDLGDTVENATRYSIGAGVYEQVMSPSKQLDYAEEFYRPLRERGKLLGLHNSNHGFRSEKEVDFHPIEMLCRELQVPFLGWQNVFSFKVGDNHKRRYNIFSHHGKYNGRSIGGALNALVSMRMLVHCCDVYVQGHIHRRICHEEQIRLPGKTNTMLMRQHFIAAGGFISYDESYAEMCGLLPPLSGSATIRLYERESRVEVIPLDL